MSLAAAWGTSTIYPLQPAIADVAASLGSSVTAVGVALACGPVGYLVGLALLVPLVDRLSPRAVVGALFGVMAAALALNAVVSGVAVLAAVMVVIGACSAVGAALSSVAGRLAAARRRATALGIVTSGIAAGILAGRVVGGWLADQIGWRAMILVFAGACGLIASGSLLLLPSTRGTAERGYLATLRSLPVLLVRHPAMRVAAIRGGLWFFAFCAVWAALAVTLSEPPYSYSADQIGLFAVAGLSGIAATRVAGSWTDRVGARTVILVGLVVAGAAAAVAGFTVGHTVVTLICLALFDAGLFAAQVANQSTVLAIDPAGPARYNSAYMLVYFVGGSLGAAFGATAADGLGWSTAVVTAAILVAIAAIVTLVAGRDR
ncbi:MFS transporter [Nakamurella lactea]|uniref:MFS transporter n=1 Tax=Nakamurella lactea TaxID=459515 RepID=UPI00056583F8